MIFALVSEFFSYASNLYTTRCPTHLIFLQFEHSHAIVTIGRLGLHCDKDLPMLYRLVLLGGPVWVGGLLVILHSVA